VVSFVDSIHVTDSPELQTVRLGRYAFSAATSVVFESGN